MHSDRIARISQQMATVTLGFIVGMMVLNAACWLFPSLGAASGPGFVFGLTDSVLTNLRVDVAAVPWWQKAVGIVLSSVPVVQQYLAAREPFACDMHCRLFFVR